MAKPATATNDFDPAIVNSLLGKIDGYDADLLSEQGSYMARCRSLRDCIKSVYDDAKAKGIPVKELKTLVKIRKNERKNQQLYQDLESDEQTNLALLAATEKVKDLPLWRASFAKDEPPAEQPEEDNAKHANFKPLH